SRLLGGPVAPGPGAPLRGLRLLLAACGALGGGRVLPLLALGLLALPLTLRLALVRRRRVRAARRLLTGRGARCVRALARLLLVVRGGRVRPGGPGPRGARAVRVLRGLRGPRLPGRAGLLPRAACRRRRGGAGR